MGHLTQWISLPLADIWRFHFQNTSTLEVAGPRQEWLTQVLEQGCIDMYRQAKLCTEERHTT